MPHIQCPKRNADGQTYDDDSTRPASAQSSLLSTPNAARFPLEIFEVVIDEMNNYTLLAAARVCAAWYPRVMRNLYHTVDITRRRRFDMLFKQCRASAHVKQWLATTRELRVTDGTTSMAAGGRNYRFLHALPPALGHAMSGVQRLAISGLRSDVHATFFPALSQSSSVESLALSECCLNLSQLRRIIYTFPMLTTLTLEDIQTAPHDIVSPVGATCFRSPLDIHLRRLHITAHRKPNFIDWIAQSGLCISLEDLTVWVHEESSRQSVSALLKTAGSSLTRLQSHYVHGDLVQNIVLRSLDLHLNDVRLTVEDQGRNTNELANQLHGVLTTIRSHQLERIELATSHLASDLERVDLRALHEATSQPHFHALKDVNVQMDMWGLKGHTKAEVEDFGRKLEAMFRGLLRPWSDCGIIKRLT
ncbi:uncharacterized protein B0H18DRAFT_1118093 [Fomitopsis serialis]|uniref:uncharacterized protein n=1 Tax=Fomitopsis serialis TaxID=139415 RepID=UPI0020072911|nr:uncharacterized protein B0H18DRAFT_1118093 [Neoantrodia serialis]KAH9928072.1 hypothetical protein B0H18DRAFT_1118093 [Neoantrodia serialis]